MAIDGIWSTRRLATHVGIPNTSLQRLIDDLAVEGTAITNWSFDRAVLAVKAYKDGHTKKAITLIGSHPHIGYSSWLVSGDNTATIFPNLLQATAHIDTHPNGTYHLSPIGAMGSEVAA
jgi:hypothetical protein